MIKRVLVIDPVAPTLLNRFEDWGWQVDYLPAITPEQVKSRLPSYEGLVLRSKCPLDADTIAVAHRLLFVARAGAGIEGIDMEACQQRAIVVFRASEGNANSVAEHTLGMLLSLMHKITKGGRESLAYRWDREGNRGIELSGKRVGIIGYGYMGAAVARLLTCLGCLVLVHDIEKKTLPPKMIPCSLKDLYRQADVVSLHVPLTKQTKHMACKEFFSSFDKEIFFVNTARGAVVHTGDLWRALATGQVKGAALDVLEEEPLTRSNKGSASDFLPELLRHPQVIITPHVAGWSVESHQRIAEVLVEKIRAHYRLS